MNHKIVVFWNQPAALTETFIYNQISNLRRYQAAILGSK
jgi:hypothetical protein